VYGVGVRPLDFWMAGLNPAESMDIRLMVVVCCAGSGPCDGLVKLSAFRGVLPGVCVCVCVCVSVRSKNFNIEAA
jgi:hypothetical protein